jgi:hypothetical protein
LYYFFIGVIPLASGFYRADRVLRNVGIENSDPGESPKRKKYNKSFSGLFRSLLSFATVALKRKNGQYRHHCALTHRPIALYFTDKQDREIDLNYKL